MEEEVYNVYLKNVDSGFYYPHPLHLVKDVVEGLYTPMRTDFTFDIQHSIPVSKNTDFLSKDFIKSKEFYNLLDPNSVLTDKHIIRNKLDTLLDTTKLIIWYPETDITNSHNLTHHNSDIYIKFVFNSEGELVGYPQLSRLTYSLSELLSGYRHSHSYTINVRNTNSIKDWSGLCFGSDFLSSHTINQSNNDNEYHLIEYFKAVEAFLGWESLEGNPYIRMETIRDYSNASSDSAAVRDNLSGVTATNYQITIVPDVIYKYIMGRRDFDKHFTLMPSVVDNKPAYKLKYDKFDVNQYILNCLIDWQDSSNYVAASRSLKEKVENLSRLTCMIIRDDFGNVTYLRDNNIGESMQIIRTRIDGLEMFKFKGKMMKITVNYGKSLPESITYNSIEPVIVSAIIAVIERLINNINGRNEYDNSQL